MSTKNGQDQSTRRTTSRQAQLRVCLTPRSARQRGVPPLRAVIAGVANSRDGVAICVVHQEDGNRQDLQIRVRRGMEDFVQQASMIFELRAGEQILLSNRQYGDGSAFIVRPQFSGSGLCFRSAPGGQG